MRFHLSTLLLAMVIVALGLGWYLDHNDPRRTEIVGTWSTVRFSGYSIAYSTTLEFQRDGKFSKAENHRLLTEVYEGTYQSMPDGTVEVHVTRKKTLHPYWHQESGTESSDPVTLDHKYKLHCAIDAAGWLLVSDAKESDMSVWDDSQRPAPMNDQECKIRWESSYERSK